MVLSAVNKSNGDITSILYNGKQLQDSSKFTQLSSELGLSQSQILSEGDSDSL